ncbi:MAG: YebC/PmpR family DNA-binding transcriptional regulator [bacterium]
MSGHSHWSSIKRAKGAADQKRGKIFSKLARQISVAARDKGGDIDANPTLRIVVEKAKSLNMPKENIERAIKKASGGLDEAKLEPFIFEAYGPEGIALIIEGITDNKNRALGDIKQILNKNNGKLANEGSVRWMFERKGSITIDNEQKKLAKEDLEIKAIEAEAEDFVWDNNNLHIFTKPEDLEKTKKSLEGQDLKVESVSLDWVAKEEISLDEKGQGKAESLFEALDENDDIQEIYSNLAG